ncbi:hypothetical protein MKW92_006140 [Papaver armeniacum]|nr:hypothetical protein MKW92_006140 [Papaver armeniacum]
MQSPGASSSSSRSRRSTTTAAKNGVIAGSVWESRMKVDEVQGGIKVFNGGDQNNAVGGGGGIDPSGNQIQVYRRRLPRIQSSNGNGGGGEIGKKQRISSAIKDREIILNNGSQSANQKKNVIDYDCDDEEEEEEEGSNLNDEETENEEIDVKEVNIDQEQLRLNVMIKNEEDNKTQMSKELVVGNLKNSPSKSEKVVICQEEKKLNEIQKTSIPISSGVSKQPPPPPPPPQPVKKYTETHPKIPPGSYEFQRCPDSQNKLQNLVDLVMWRDVSKSALVFGFGAFLILSSSFTKDLNFSLISAISYMGLLYLATRFLYTSIICRGAAYSEEESHETLMVGEEEAVWLLRLILPYLNEFLIKLKSIFSGDPATTMKLGVLLFILARCGSSITIWKVAKLGFFGIFTVPKVCSSYSTQLTGYGKFWIRRFQDAWNSCTHKKAVALAGFTLVWNLSSIVARIWAVFMLIVAIRYYQQSLVLLNEGWGSKEEEIIAVDRDDSSERYDCVSTTSIKEVVLEEKKKDW